MTVDGAIQTQETETILGKITRSKRVDFRWLDEREITGLRNAFDRLYDSEQLSTTETGERLGKSQQFAWSICKRLGIELRSRSEGGRLYAPKRTANTRRPFDETSCDRAYLQGFAHGDLDVRRASSLAIMVSTTTTHRDFTLLFRSPFGKYGPVYVYPIFDRSSGYKWKVAARLDNSFEFLLPERRNLYQSLTSKEEFFAWLAGLVDSDGSVGIIHSERYARINIQVANEEGRLLEYVKKKLIVAGCNPTGPYVTRRKGYVTSSRHIKYNADMSYLLLQSAAEVKRILVLLHLRHPEKCLRKELVHRLPTPALWSRVGDSIESMRKQTKVRVAEYVSLAEETYKNSRNKGERESLTWRLSRV